MNPPHADLVLSWISICASPNFDILGVKFDSRLSFEDHAPGIVSRVSQIIDILRLAKRFFVDTSVLLRWYFAFALPILEYCSPVLGPRLMCGITFPTLCLIQERQLGLREQSVVGCFPVIIFEFSVVHVLVGLWKQFMNILFFIAGSVLLVLMIIKILIATWMS